MAHECWSRRTGLALLSHSEQLLLQTRQYENDRATSAGAAGLRKKWALRCDPDRAIPLSGCLQRPRHRPRRSPALPISSECASKRGLASLKAGSNGTRLDSKAGAPGGSIRGMAIQLDCAPEQSAIGELF